MPRVRAYTTAPMFRPREAISTVPNRTHGLVRRRSSARGWACVAVALTSCASATVVATPHLASIQSAVTCPAPPVHNPIAHPLRRFTVQPKAMLEHNVGYCAYIGTTRGVISVRLRPEYAPKAVNDFVFLAKQGFYDGLAVDQVCPATAGMACPAQVPIAIAGDPTALGTGGPGYSLKADAVVGQYLFGAVAMYTSGSVTLGSQFLISAGDSRALPRLYDIRSGHRWHSGARRAPERRYDSLGRHRTYRARALKSRPKPSRTISERSGPHEWLVDIDASASVKRSCSRLGIDTWASGAGRKR